MKVENENLRRIYKPNYTYTIVFILMAAIMLSGILFAMNSSFAGIQNLMVLLPLSIQFLGWVICIPLVRIHFAIVLTEDGIRGSNGILPFFSQKISLPWNQMREIKIKNYILFSFLEISSSKGQNKIIIPLGIDHLPEFSNAIKKLSPSTCSLRLIYEENIDRIGDLRFIQVQLSGSCSGPGNKIFPLSSIILKKGKILIIETKTDMKGSFFLEVSLIPGNYSLWMETMDFSGELKINIDRGYYKNLLVTANRKS